MHQTTFKNIDQQLALITDFLRRHDMLHFDINLKNILTDGRRLFLTNFYLATSKDFDLTASEINFYNRHENYDTLCARSSMIEWILTKMLPLKEIALDSYVDLLQHYIDGKSLDLPMNLNEIVSNHAKSALTIHHFSQRFKTSREARVEHACL